MRSYLDFEKPVAELEAKADELQVVAESSGSAALTKEIEGLLAKAQTQLREIYGSLTPWQKTMVARHPLRPHFRDYLTALIEDYFADMTSLEVVTKLDAAGIANGRLNEADDVWNHVQFRERDRWREIATPGGPVRALLPPFSFAGVEATMGPVPALGEHTDAVLRELGYAPAEIHALHTAGAV